jgi:3-hydroxyisobutyrate dehydrogenase-like beta-hydroxyacid dehydrogenase
MKPEIGVVGLGIMGGAMAEALLERGYRVCGFDVARAPLRRLKKAGGEPLASAAAVAERADIVITALATIRALDIVAEQLAAEKRDARRPRLVVVEMSTLPLEDKTRARDKLARAGASLLDCPVSGTAVRMKEGAWTVFVSGDAAAAKRIAPVLEVFTRKAPYVGVFGNGTRMKFVANHLVAIYNVAVAESITFARKMGLDAQQVWDLFAASPIVGNGVFRLRGKFMVDRSYLPATMKVEVWQKDMQVIGDMTRAVGAPTPLFSACAPIYNAAMAHGLAQHDTASVAEVLGEMARVPLKGSAPKSSRRKTISRKKA